MLVDNDIDLANDSLSAGDNTAPARFAVVGVKANESGLAAFPGPSDLLIHGTRRTLRYVNIPPGLFRSLQ
jgi:hypothetical protein